LKSILLRFFFLLAVTGLAYGQTPEKLPSFEAADVHSSPKNPNPNVQSLGASARGGRYQFKNATMVDLISDAYGVEPANVVGGPFWLETDRFDILAKAPTSVTTANTKLMLRSLLADRFKLVIHSQETPMNVWAMIAVNAGKPGPQLKEAKGGGPTNQCNGQPNGPNTTLTCVNVSMAFLTEFARRQIAGIGALEPVTDTNPVADLTEFQGNWDLQLTWTNPAGMAAAGKDAIALRDAFEKQLGIKLEQQMRPIATLVVESVNRKPTGNVPGIEKLLPVVSTEFEVAELKPSAPNARPGGGLRPGGRIDFRGFKLKQLIVISTGLATQNIDDGSVTDLISGPKFLDTDKYDVVAKAPSDTDPDTIRLMLRTLLIERFKVKYHVEDQPINVWALTFQKKDARLKPADPNSRSTCKRTNAANSFGVPTVTLTCQNTTLSQLADKLPAMARDYVDHPAVDASGLDGGFDFALSWTPRAQSESGQRGQAPGGGGGGRGGDASEPNGALSLFEGVQRLGLNLEIRKQPYPVVVIDSMEAKPTEN
jgi:uncharacterized protein (TIGR03435 family)